MKIPSLLILALFALISCSKSDDDGTTITPVNNGPLGGTYNFTGSTTVSYDTTTGPGIMTAHEYNTTTTNHAGTMTITGTTITSKGLMYNYSTSGTRKETNTNTGATTTTNLSAQTGSGGSSTSNYSSNYIIDVPALQLTVENGQYLFNPAFLSQPANKKYSYIVSGNTLKIITTYYDPSTRYRSVNEATFTKQ